MTPKDFFDLVKRMRSAQIKYFKTRSSVALQESKKYEKECDAEIERVETILNDKQMKLFEL